VKSLKIISALLTKLENGLVVLLLGSMVVLAFLQVILRNVFSTGLMWADPFLRHLVLWIGFLGASLATQQEKHINLDILTRYLSPRWVSVVRTLANAFAVVVTAFLARAGWTFVQNEMGSPEPLFTIGQTAVPAWWLQLIIPIGFALMAFRFAIRAISHGNEIFRPPTEIKPSTNIPTIPF
jgi:C4-dicarboxylate transporter DctQ subunit